MTEIKIDASDFAKIEAAIRALPADIRHKVMSKAIRGVMRQGRSRVVDRIAERMKLPKNVVRRTLTAFDAGDSTVLRARSKWLSLYRIGATQTASGVNVRARGSYQSAFIATMNGGTTVFKRETAERNSARALYGPNPAHDITASPADYERVIIEIAALDAVPRIRSELAKVLPK